MWADKLVEQIRDLGYEYEIEVFYSGEAFLNSSMEYFVVFLDIECVSIFIKADTKGEIGRGDRCGFKKDRR